MDFLPFPGRWAQKHICQKIVPQIFSPIGDFFSEFLVYAQSAFNVSRSLGDKLLESSLCAQTLRIHVVPFLRNEASVPNPLSKWFYVYETGSASEVSAVNPPKSNPFTAHLRQRAA